MAPWVWLGFLVATAADMAVPLRVHVHNYAGADAAAVLAGAAVARDVFQRAGVETVWAVCVGPSRPDCGGTGKSVLRVNLLTREQAGTLGLEPNAFGLAFSAYTGLGTVAAVFHHRVVELERDWGAARAVVLGHVLAHEVGRLLLGRGSHSQEGIMRADWCAEDLVEAVQGATAHLSRAGGARSRVASSPIKPPTRAHR